jgi:hypothetical protein
MKKFTKAHSNETCQNTLDLQLLPLMKTPPGKVPTFYCIKHNKMTCKEDCERCPYFKK